MASAGGSAAGHVLKMALVVACVTLALNAATVQAKFEPTARQCHRCNKGCVESCPGQIAEQGWCDEECSTNNATLCRECNATAIGRCSADCYEAKCVGMHDCDSDVTNMCICREQCLDDCLSIFRGGHGGILTEHLKKPIYPFPQIPKIPSFLNHKEPSQKELARVNEIRTKLCTKLCLPVCTQKCPSPPSSSPSP